MMSFRLKEVHKMPTAESIKNKIQNLISRSNATTGNSATDLTSAVDGLIGGYGQGVLSGITTRAKAYRLPTSKGISSLGLITTSATSSVSE